MPRQSDDDTDPSGSESSESESSDSENTSDEGPIATNDKQALKTTQLENAKLRRELKELRLAVNSNLVKVQNANPRHKPKIAVSEKLTTFDRDIALYGRKYSFMIGPWVDNNIFTNVVGRPDVDPFGDARFDKKSKKAMQNGELAELYDFLPSVLHDPLQNHSRFSHIFRRHLQNTRCNGVLAVRQKAGLIFDLKQEYFESAFDCASVPELQKLLKNPPNDEYATLAPILFPGGQYDSTKKTLFRNIALCRIIKTLICGRSSTTSEKSISKPQTLAELWGVTCVTLGTIAFSAVLARFMLSPDGELRRIGGKTGISWIGEFLKYKKLLVVKSRKMEELFQFFNDNVFGSSSKANVQSEVPDYNSEELDDALQAFMNDSFEEDIPTSLIKSLTITPHQDDPLDLEVRRGSDKPPGSTIPAPLSARAETNEEPDIVEIKRAGGQRDGAGTTIDVDDTGGDSAEGRPEKAGRKKRGTSATPVTIEDDDSGGTTRQQSEKPNSKKKKSSAATVVNETDEGNQAANPARGKGNKQKSALAATSKVASKPNSVTRKSKRGGNAAIVCDAETQDE